MKNEFDSIGLFSFDDSKNGHDDGVSMLGLDPSDRDDGFDNIRMFDEAEEMIQKPIDEEEKEVIGEVLYRLKEQAKTAMDKYNLATDFDYFACVVFKSREQRDAFVTAAGWDKYGSRYLNGIEIADQMGIELPDVQLSARKDIIKNGINDLILD